MTDASSETIEAVALPLIATAGEGRALVFEALDLAIAGDVDAARERLAEADSRLQEAHLLQYDKLIRAEASGEQVPISLLVIHAMDSLMIALSERDLARRLIDGRVLKKTPASEAADG